MRKKFTLFIVFLLYGFSIAMAQDITVKGAVKDQQGLPLPGVSVKVKGSSQGAMTSTDGTYVLKAPASATLSFSFIGYKTTEQAISGRTTVNVSLSEDNNQLNEVIVVGYGTQTKKDLTTAVVSISSKDLQNQPVTNPLQAIQGKAAGVQITSQSGKPGAGVSVSIRGNTSITASNSPLYVIDGVTSRNADFLNPNDIESLTILKDASAAAIYGSSGANGVVLITTKKGTAGKLQVGFNAFTGFSNLWKKENVLNNVQYAALMKELGYTTIGNANTDWQDLAFGTGHQNSYQVSLAGGVTGGQYYFSTGYQQDKGTVAPAKMDKYTLNFNGSQNLTKWLKLTGSAALTARNSIDVNDNNGVANGGVILAALTTPPTIGVYAPNGQYQGNPNKGGWENPIANAYGSKNATRNFRFLGSFGAQVNFTKDFWFKSSISSNINKNFYDYFLDPFMTDYGRVQQGIYRNNKTNDQVWLNENILNYSKNVGKNAFTATAGMTLQSSDYKYYDYEETKFLDANGKLLPKATSITPKLPTFSQWSKRSYLARVTYAYDGKYLFSSNFRADGSSRFPKENRYGYFPSVSAGWRISGENFLKDSKTINDLKIRGSWGKVGNDEGIGDYAYLELYQPTPQGSYNFKQLKNPDLRWEETTQTNIGLDLSLFDSRITFTADAYLKKTNNLLINVPLPQSIGFDSQARNVGSMENKGLEFVLSTKNFVKDKFTWTTDINLSINRNKVTSLGNSVTSINFGGVYQRDDAIRVEVGRPLGSFYGYVFTGVNPQTGAATYADLNNNGSLDAGDRTFIGNAQPKFTYGVNNNLTYGPFGLSLFFQGVQGNDIFNASRIDLESLNDSKNQSSAVLNRWTTPGQITDIPKAEKDNTINSYTSSRFVENGSYLRLKTATLSYNFGAATLGKWKMSKLSVFATSYNLLTFTKYKGFDPEVQRYEGNGPSMGVDYGTYPQARTFLFGVNVGF
ncbi:SusC/RagA family TonB-linked outer membrane protein [Pedobacter nutrimenti]|uniref:TonB-linked SusC/RagA family outer membrane protein n=1 Tax=Pedobacter nutrimenti TaxID=1241337 RepID=A0A318U9V3_9SPHI|nr:TonB-dependent receptor [Pedobacter nutrimenti]PYF72371.1 TonB-linked SusC/RagA family outer membrane protein [Pedobacter nutrimenti]